MTPEEFANNLKLEMEYLLALFRGNAKEGVKTQVASVVESMELNEQQHEALHQVLKLVVEDTLYTVVCGLEGVAPIGGERHHYKLLDDSGNELTGELDRLFYERLLEEDKV